MQRIREICKHCPDWFKGRFELEGYCNLIEPLERMDDKKIRTVPKNCRLQMEYIIMRQNEKQTK